jgi:hypothetical protein
VLRCFDETETSRPSIATVSVAGAGPNRRAEAKMNASDAETDAASEGSLIENGAVKSVRLARTNQCQLVWPAISSRIDHTTGATPQKTTAHT